MEKDPKNATVFFVIKHTLWQRQYGNPWVFHATLLKDKWVPCNFPQLISWFISFSFYCVLNNIQPLSYLGPSCLFCGKLGYSIFSPVFILSMPSYHIMIKKVFINTCKHNWFLFSPLLTGSFIDISFYWYFFLLIFF